MAYMNPQGLPTPGLTDSYMSNFDATYYNTTLVPAYAKTIINKYGDQGLSDFLFIASIGGREAITSDLYSSWERGFLTQTITAAEGVTGGSAGAAITFDLTAGAVTSLGNAFVRVNDTLINLTSEQAYIVDDVTVSGGTATITVTPLLGSVTAAVLTNDVLMIIGNAWDEGTEQPESIQNSWYKYTSRPQIFKDTYMLSGSMKTNQPQWYQGPDGTFISEGAMAAEYRMAKAAAYTMLYGTSKTNAAVSQRTSTGLHNEVSARGLVYDYGTAATDFTVDDLIAVKNAQLKRWAGNLFLAWVPTPMQDSLNASLLSANYLNNSNIQNATEKLMSNTFVGNNKVAVENLQTTLGWDAVNVAGVTFVIKNLAMLNDPQGAGASATGFTQKTGYVIPLNTTEDRDTGDLKSHVQLIYKAMNGYNRLFNVTRDGRASDRQIGPRDVDALYYSAEMGWHFRGLEQFTKLNTTGV